MSILRWMTFNIAHGRGLSLYQGFSSAQRIHQNLKKIARMLIETRVDIVALQEVDEASHWTRGVNLLEILQKEAGFTYAAMGVNNRREHPRRPLAYGNAILSRYPIQKIENRPFGQATVGEKGFLYAEIDYLGQILPFINVHLDYRSRRRRLDQVEKIIEFLRANFQSLKDDSSPPVILGDFNSRAQVNKDAVAYLFNYILSHSPYVIQPQGVGTFPTHLPSKKLSRGIDFFLLPKIYHLLHCEVIPGYFSDHRPVLVEVKID